MTGLFVKNVLGLLGKSRTPYSPSRHQTRNGHSQQPRRERRAAACQAAAEQVKASLSLEEKDVLKKAEKAEAEFVTEKVIRAEAKVAEKVIDIVTIEEVKDTEQVVQDEAVDRANIVHDEFCSNASYSEGKSTPTPSPSALPTPRPSRGLGSFDYDSLKFEDFYDDDPD